METLGASVDEMIDAIFGEESAGPAAAADPRWDEDDDE